MINYIRMFCLTALSMVALTAFTGCEVEVDDGPVEDAAEELTDD